MITIGTHDGSMHADEVFACAALKLLHFGSDIEFKRTRSQEILDRCSYVVDVGYVLDPFEGRFDHHQRGGAGRRENGVPYASAGLVWRAVGEEVCGSIKIANEIDRLIMQKIDAADCGYSMAGLDRTYSAIISDFNPAWDSDSGALAFDCAFSRAVEFAVTILNNAIRQGVSTESAARRISELKPTDGILIMDGYIPWQEAVIDTMPDVMFAVFPDLSGSWKVQAAPVARGSFVCRKYLPKTWGGLDGKELDEVSGLEGCIFCHPGLFIAGNKSKEGAIAMARKALLGI